MSNEIFWPFKLYKMKFSFPVTLTNTISSPILTGFLSSLISLNKLSEIDKLSSKYSAPKSKLSLPMISPIILPGISSIYGGIPPQILYKLH